VSVGRVVSYIGLRSNALLSLHSNRRPPLPCDRRSQGIGEDPRGRTNAWAPSLAHEGEGTIMIEILRDSTSSGGA